ncbi:hypothetical protein [Desulfovibrio sp. An276]|uniref:hypothetical protein n=1 Tax=Desulfovibrio sp. An276 TaxID=1965618 RepID=UPI0013A683A4|nr:hypothetical protein [Desulfovibrio sp. An276]
MQAFEKNALPLVPQGTDWAQNTPCREKVPQNGPYAADALFLKGRAMMTDRLVSGGARTVFCHRRENIDLVSSVCGNISMQVKGIEQDVVHIFWGRCFLYLR